MLPRKLRIQYGYCTRIKIGNDDPKKTEVDTFNTFRISAYEGLAPSRKISTEGKEKHTVWNLNVYCIFTLAKHAQSVRLHLQHQVPPYILSSAFNHMVMYFPANSGVLITRSAARLLGSSHKSFFDNNTVSRKRLTICLLRRF